eukprot:g46998.t1
MTEEENMHPGATEVIEERGHEGTRAAGDARKELYTGTVSEEATNMESVHQGDLGCKRLPYSSGCGRKRKWQTNFVSKRIDEGRAVNIVYIDFRKAIDKVLHEERPNTFASRTLTETEENYAQVEKDGLSIMFGINVSLRLAFCAADKAQTSNQYFWAIYGDTVNDGKTAAEMGTGS